ncbi:hypothetical protein AMAG_04374 [Allomyces macrogynus ATCC 38327]|uniref:ATP-dependent DNA helicase n=1 Tax=Allomyces macrogynus (strain ATCC 38327) TaxID=578462 RepID=A0A0L0S8U6_ALLM3|nr:hypothetical protein AMAG_04374 [Allomyces macrogynus ATCC 38327]|eukprot:KNE58829.1 hypothetical protein AMAG_04374 [Allomyces macrogynus ATCC 38327]
MTRNAAESIGGQTVHRFGGINMGTNRAVESMRDIDVLTVDEISMMSANIFERLNQTLQKCRGSPEFFGGLQVIFVGDMFQLPPRRTQHRARRQPLLRDDPFVFEAPSFADGRFHVVNLETVFRQAGALFQHFLELPKSACAILAQICKPNDNSDPSLLRLFMRNKDVQKYNEMRIKALKTEGYKDDAKDWLREDMGTVHEKLLGALAPLSLSTLTLKVGAPVMCIRDIDRDLVHGARGVVIAFDAGFPVVDNSRPSAGSGGGVLVQRVVRPYMWSCNEYEDDEGKSITAQVATREQARLVLGKRDHHVNAQGLSLDGAVVHLTDDRIFPHLVYVALSRVRDDNNLPSSISTRI